MCPCARVNRPTMIRVAAALGAPRAIGGVTVRIAVMTMVRNEGAILPRWQRYYGGQVGPRNLFVLDDMSTDGSLDSLDATVIHLPTRATVARRSDQPGPHDSSAGAPAFRKTAAANKFAAALLEFYQAVIFVDADEFIVPDPRSYDSLQDFMRKNEDPVIAPLGLNIVHRTDAEATLRPDELLLRQRRYVKVSSLMSKPAIKRVPARWTGGTHGIAREYRVRTDIFLLHAKFADAETLRRVHAQRHNEFLATGAGGRSTWSMPPERMEAALSDWMGVRSRRRIQDFDPDAIDVSDFVREKAVDDYRSGVQSVRASMKRQPLQRLPDYLSDQF